MREQIGSEKRWYAIRTRFKCEKRVASDLFKKGIEAYVPLITKTKRYTRKIVDLEIPLIYNYVFVNISREQYIPVLQHPNVIEFVKPGNRIIHVPEEEINILRRVCGEINLELIAEECTFIPGEEVELIYGHLSGLKGILLESRGKHEFVIQLKYIGYQLRMIVDSTMLGKLARTA